MWEKGNKVKNKIVLFAIAIIILAVATITADGRIAPPSAAAQEEGVTHHLSLEENLATEDVARYYRAELPPGLQGKLVLEYNYEISPSGDFVVNHRWTAIERVDALSYWVRVLDNQGKDVSTRLELLDVPESLRAQFPRPQYALYYGAATGPLIPGHVVEGATRGEIRDGVPAPIGVDILILSYQIGETKVSIPSPDLGEFIN